MKKSFTDLAVYKSCRKFRKSIQLTASTHFPPNEQRRLTDQIIRSSRSITANFAEGYGRFYYKEAVRFYRISRGSLEETLEHLITAYDENYINAEQLAELKNQYDDCIKLLNGYIRFLLKNKKPEF